MQEIERQVRREARAMTRREIITKAIAKRLSWIQAAEIIGIKPRQMRRIRWRVEHYGLEAVMDQRGGRPRRKRIKAGTIELLCRLKRDLYPDFSLWHFYEHVTEKHGVKVSYQGRLPQELRHQCINDYATANHYLEQHFIPDFNRRFTIKPAQPESAFVKLTGIELELVLSSKHERVVRNDNTVTFQNLILQLPSTRHRMHFVRCPVIVHQFANATLGISYQGRLLARYDALGGPLNSCPNKERTATAQRLASTAVRRVATHWRTRIQNPHFSARTPIGESAGGKILLSQISNQSQEITPT